MGRCIAQSKRSGEQCKNWAVRKKTTCRFHGGKSTGPKTDAGKKKIRTLHYQHGLRSKETEKRRKRVSKLIKDSKNFLGSFE